MAAWHGIQSSPETPATCRHKSGIMNLSQTVNRLITAHLTFMNILEWLIVRTSACC